MKKKKPKLVPARRCEVHFFSLELPLSIKKSREHQKNLSFEKKKRELKVAMFHLCLRAMTELVAVFRPSKTEGGYEVSSIGGGSDIVFPNAS